LQHEGREFRGEFVAAELNSPVKRVELEFARAYPLTDLASLRRQIAVVPAGKVTLQDVFRFAANPAEIEEAFVTWCDAEVNGATAIIRAERHAVRLTIESPSGALFELERLEKESRENFKPQILKRLTVRLPAESETQFRMRIEVEVKA
jgi:hypothetical protein